MKKVLRNCFISILFTLGCIVTSKGQINYDGVYLIDVKAHMKYIDLFKKSDKRFLQKIDIFKKTAEKILNKEVYSVTFDKVKIAASGDKHDFYSQSPYYFVGKSGKSFMKDGTRNTQIKEYKDKEQLTRLIDDLQVLSITYFYTNDERFAKKARKLMDTWFINGQTKMNPNMNFAQVKPNTKQGTFSGIIESRQLVCIPDILYLLRDSREIDPAFVSSMRQWFKSYLSWLKSSRLGKIAAVQHNNQINYYNLQVYVFNLFTGIDIKQVRILLNRTKDDIASQINEKGEQNAELKRVTPIGYSLFNLKALSLIALFSENIQGPDIWNYERNGRGIKNAFVWIGQQYLNQKENKKASPKFENILPGHLRGLYTLAQPRIRDLSLSYLGIDQSTEVTETYFRFN